MTTKTLTQAQLTELQRCLQRINNILGLPISLSDAHPSDVKRPVPRPHKRATHRVTTATFTYRWLTSSPQRITLLYQHLIRAQWIAAETRPDEFFSLFEGQDTPVRVKWTGTSLQLAYLIRVLTEKSYITTPKGIGKWTCVYNHFVDRNNHQLPKLNALHIPCRSRTVIEKLAELLNPNE